METYIANFVLAPSNRYVGWIVYNNGYYFGSGNNLSDMVTNIKQVLYKRHGKYGNVSITLASKSTPKELVPLEKMSPKFKTLSYFAHKSKDKLTKDQKVVWSRTKKQDEPVKPNQPQYIFRERNGEMCVYEVKEVARYKMYKAEDSVLQEYLKH